MKVELDSINTISGVKFWGIRLFEDGKRVGTYNLRLSDMKELGIVSRLSEKSKLLKWLNSDEGNLWLKDRLTNPTYTFLGFFL